MSDTVRQGTPLPATPAAPTPPPVAAPAAVVQAGIEDFQKISLKIGTILTAEDHPKADRLLVLTVDIGEAAPRQVVAGIKAFYQPADLVGKQVVVVSNLKPATLRGAESQGMVLAASNGTSLVLVHPGQSMPNGSIVK